MARSPTKLRSRLAAMLVGGTLAAALPGAVARADDQALLAAHNSYRAQHCVAALSWSEQLAQGARDWASACAFQHSQGDYGENLFMGSGRYNEIADYDFDNPVYDNKVGHFTQMVWKDSTMLGCGVATCGDQTLWVCRYSPPGNFNVDTPGVLAEQVPRKCN